MELPPPLPAAIIPDANVIISALIRGRARLIFETSLNLRCLSPITVAEEVAEHLPRVAAKAKINMELALRALGAIPVEWQSPAIYEPFREAALARIASRDPEDWPVVALALATDLPIWSQDKDFEIIGLPVYTTGRLLDILRDEERSSK
ncbi:MAG: PIN domain-containing protein [Candidatus Dormibacteraceae bacterium]